MPIPVGALTLYLENPMTRSILLNPVRKRIFDATTSSRDLLSSNFTAEEMKGVGEKFDQVRAAATEAFAAVGMDAFR